MKSNRSLPNVVMIPELAYGDVREAAGWLCRAFGFAPRLWIEDHRAQLTLGGGAVVLTKATTPDAASILVRVENLDAHFERALAAGAEMLRLPATYPFGERQYSCRDLGGHLWTFSETVADIDPAAWGGMLVHSSQGK